MVAGGGHGREQMAHDRVTMDPQPDGRSEARANGRKVLTLRSAAPVTPAPADAAAAPAAAAAGADAAAAEAEREAEQLKEAN